MARPHIEFVQAQSLPWTVGAPPDPFAGLPAKTLSRDAEADEVTAIVRLPAGWQRPAGTLERDTELFVLNGTLGIGDQAHGPDCYAFFPGGHRLAACASGGGATVLGFWSGPLDAAIRAGAAERLVTRIDVREGAWQADLAAMGLDVMAADARIRRLRSDPISGEMTYITAVMPYWREREPERHPVAQEFFVLAGTIAGNTGIMQAGAYVWRPREVVHGPYGSTTGAVVLFRSRGGTLTTTHEPAVGFSYEPPHRPVLPPDLAAHGAAPLAPLPRY